MKTKPMHEIRLGSVKAAVWRHDTQNSTRFSVTFRRLYKDGGKWKFTDGFGRDDLLTLAKVADLTHSWICVQTKSGQGAEQDCPPRDEVVTA